jgi:hypothetical protein
MEFKIGQKILITTDNWFYAPNGNSYKAVYGTVKKILKTENFLSVKRDNRTASWGIEIGNMIIAGCQIHYAIATDYCSDLSALGWDANSEFGCKTYYRPCSIYFADEIFINKKTDSIIQEGLCTQGQKNIY